MSRILIVDDEEQIRRLFKTVFERIGYQVETAENGKQACDMYREDQYDLIILDIVMPEQEGTETIIELCRDFPDIKIIAVSGGGHTFGPNCILKVAESLGAVQAFSKPVDLKDLQAAVERQIGRPS